MLCGYFDIDLWKMFAELSYFYRQLCVKQVSKTMMQKFEKEILILVCKMESDQRCHQTRQVLVYCLLPQNVLKQPMNVRQAKALNLYLQREEYV
jgi:hypothetical protein